MTRKQAYALAPPLCSLIFVRRSGGREERPQLQILGKIYSRSREMKSHGVEDCCCGGSGFVIAQSLKFPSWKSRRENKMQADPGGFPRSCRSQNEEACLRPRAFKICYISARLRPARCRWHESSGSADPGEDTKCRRIKDRPLFSF